MINPAQLRDKIIRPTLVFLGLHSAAAENLLLGTAIAESTIGMTTWLAQNGGPAMGIYQMEPATHNDLWKNYLAYKKPLADKIAQLMVLAVDDTAELAGNFYYASAMTRIHYLRVKEPLPASLEEQAYYWKRYYNTRLGKGTVEHYLAQWRKAGL